VFVDSS
jgi:saccharopepsin